MIAARNVGYRIGPDRWLVHNVSLSLAKGEFVVLIGPNGAGKTTLLRLLTGELSPSTGEVLLHNRPLKHYTIRELALQRSVMRQQIDMNFDFSVQEVVMMGRHPHIRLLENEHDRQIVDNMLRLTQSDMLHDRQYTTLSGGEKARVTLARVLAQQTPLVVLDEPTSAMDLRHQHMTMQIARQLAANGKTVLSVLHDLNLAAMYADRIGIMTQSRLMIMDSPQVVLTAEHIEAAFGIRVSVLRHPEKDCPVIVPLHGKQFGQGK